MVNKNGQYVIIQRELRGHVCGVLIARIAFDKRPGKVLEARIWSTYSSPLTCPSIPFSNLLITIHGLEK